MMKPLGLEEFGSDKSKCQDHFDVYKECKKKEVLVNFHSNFSACICISISDCFFFFACLSEGSSIGAQ